MRYKMLNLTPHHRLHVPNGLAVLAAVLLLVISAANFNSSSETDPSGAKASHHCEQTSQPEPRLTAFPPLISDSYDCPME